MAKENVQVELSLYLRTEAPAEVPLEVYDALYYSGHFDPIYRVQGDMVLSAFYSAGKTPGMRLRQLGRKLLKELTVDLKEKHEGTEVKVENLMPVFEEESSFYRDPKVRISTRAMTSMRRLSESLASELETLTATESVLLKVEKLRATDDARISLTLSGVELDSAVMKEVHARLSAQGARSSSTKHVWNMDFKRQNLQAAVLPQVLAVMDSVHG